jgi:hypothetical protein
MDRLTKGIIAAALFVLVLTLICGVIYWSGLQTLDSLETTLSRTQAAIKAPDGTHESLVAAASAMIQMQEAVFSMYRNAVQLALATNVVALSLMIGIAWMNYRRHG